MNILQPSNNPTPPSGAFGSADMFGQPGVNDVVNNPLAQYMLPPPANSGEADQRRASWQQVLQDPKVTAMIGHIGRQLLQPIPPGQTTLGHLGAGMESGVDYLAQMQQEEALRKEAQQKLDMEQQRTTASVQQADAITAKARQDISFARDTHDNEVKKTALNLQEAQANVDAIPDKVLSRTLGIQLQKAEIALSQARLGWERDPEKNKLALDHAQLQIDLVQKQIAEVGKGDAKTQENEQRIMFKVKNPKWVEKQAQETGMKPTDPGFDAMLQDHAYNEIHMQQAGTDTADIQLFRAFKLALPPGTSDLKVWETVAKYRIGELSGQASAGSGVSPNGMPPPGAVRIKE